MRWSERWVCSQVRAALLAYAAGDTRVLLEALKAFAASLNSMYPDIDIWQSLTLSGLTNRIYRIYHMPINCKFANCHTGNLDQHQSFQPS